MKSYKKIYIGIVCIISFSYIGNLIYYYNNKLDKPCFLQHYYDLEQGEMFTLYFLDNKVINEKDKITNIGIGNYKFNINNQYNDYYNYNKPGALRLRAIDINPNGRDSFRGFMQDETVGSYKEITIHYGEKVETVPIGKLSFKKENVKTRGEEILSDRGRQFNEEKYQFTLFPSEAMRILEVKDKHSEDDIEVFSDYIPYSSDNITKRTLPFYVESQEIIIIKVDVSKMVEKASKEGLVFNYPIEVVYESMDGSKGTKTLNVNIVPNDANIDIKATKESLRDKEGEM